MKILMIEDDSMFGETLQRGLAQSGHAVDWLRDGETGDHALLAQKFDVVLLDLGLPKRNGLNVLCRMRERGDVTPVIILTARDEINDRITGLDQGADDYLSKPFALDELEARIRALQRRHSGYASPILTCGVLELNPATKTVALRGGTLALSGREYHILAALMRRPGAILSRAQLEEQLYDWGSEVASNAVEVHIHRLRQKIPPEMIRTIRGLGYQIVVS